MMTPSKKLTSFAERIYAWRRERNMVQKQAAEHFGVETRTYRGWEKGSRTPPKLTTMADVERKMLEPTKE